MGLGARYSKSTVLCGCAKANSVLGGTRRGMRVKHGAMVGVHCSAGAPQQLCSHHVARDGLSTQQMGTWGCLRALLLAFPHSHSLVGVLGRFATSLLWLKQYRRLVYGFCWFLVCSGGELALFASEGEKGKEVASLFSPSLTCELSAGQTCYFQSAWARLGEFLKCEQS